ncbi:hypothetical protein UFOVP350_2 [uncultured Caudovirales phage]|uniref:Uncharacterized protein n=1 Tax=uncultured Caudovirales phage TaxID=2100421 RepID=A0A6J5M4L3_9CAUD|nr:hypothetical protein UFOVP350_2 [uncultured Caudovirales phage]
MQLIELHDYLKKIAEEHRAIGHTDERPRFFFYHYESLTQDFNTMEDVCLTVESPIGSMVREAKEYRDRKRFALVVHVQAGSLNSNVDRLKASDKAERIMKDIIARMLHDSELKLCPILLRNVDASGWVYEHMESKLQNFVSCVLGVELVGYDYLQYDANQWL